MGFRPSVIAVNHLTMDELLEAKNLGATGERSEDYYSGDTFCAFEGHDPWKALICGTATGFSLDDAKELSRSGSALFFACETSVMVSEIYYYDDGELTWQIDYIGANGISRPTVTGEPPQILSQLLAEAAEELAADPDPADHMFEVSLQLMQRTTGFHPEQGGDVEDPEPFQELEPMAGPKAKGFLHRLFRI